MASTMWKRVSLTRRVRPRPGAIGHPAAQPGRSAISTSRCAHSGLVWPRRRRQALHSDVEGQTHGCIHNRTSICNTCRRFFRGSPLTRTNPFSASFWRPSRSSSPLSNRSWLRSTATSPRPWRRPPTSCPGWQGGSRHLFDEEWDEDRRRRFLAAAMELYRWRGTVGGLKRYLDLCLDLGPGRSRYPRGPLAGRHADRRRLTHRLCRRPRLRTCGAAQRMPPATLTQGDIIGQRHDY